MVFPQAKICWDNGFEFGRPDWMNMDTIFTRSGAQNLFMKAIVDRMKDKRDLALKESKGIDHEISKNLKILKQGKSPYNHPADFHIKMTEEFSMHADCRSEINLDGKLAGNCVNR